MFDVPNLDCLSTDPDDYIEACAVFTRLAAYCDARGRAMDARLAGDLKTALSLERTADDVYRHLPKWARW